MKLVEKIPKSHPVQPLKPGEEPKGGPKDKATCGHCGLSWDDGEHPAPSARCQFEYYHIYPQHVTYTIRNSFHNTEARVRVDVDSGILSPRQVLSVRNKLCGIEGCTCGGSLGQRGPQECRIEETGRNRFRLFGKDGY